MTATGRLSAALMAVLVLGIGAADAQIFGNRNEYSQESSQSFVFADGDSITATTPDGDVTVTAWDRTDVSLVVTKRIRTRRDESEIEKYFDDMRVDIDASSSSIRIVGEVPNHRWGHGFSIDYEMHVPVGVDVELRSSDGRIEVTGSRGEVYAKTSDGDITVHAAGSVEVQSSDGNIRVRDAEGSVRAVTSDGDIRVSEVAGDVNLRSSDGNIDCDDIAGAVAIQLSDGDARVTSARQGIQARTSDGDLIVEDAAGAVELKSSDGDIELAMAESASISGVTCTSSDGNIDVKVSKSAAFTIAARTSDGQVRVALPGDLDRDEKGKRVEGKVNGGGPQVTLRTSDGSIRVDEIR